MKRATTILLVIGCFLALGATGQAVTVTVNGSRYFDSGGFEADTPQWNPQATTAGGWLIDETLGYVNGTIDVVGPAMSGPGAAEGDNYMSITNDAEVPGRLVSAIAALADPAVTGDSVVADFDVYVDSADNTRIASEGTHVLIDFTKDLFGFYGSHHTWLSFCFPEGDVPSIVSSDGWQERQLYVVCYAGGWQNVTTAGGTTNMFIDPDAWHDVQVDLTVGSSWTVTIDGFQSDPIDVEAGFAADSVVGLQFFHNCYSQDGLFYIDGPENAPLPDPGDANDDGFVDDKDASILGAHWLLQTGATWSNGDFNGDKKVDDRDAAILAAHWTGPPEGDASVPEPGIFALLLGALAMLCVGKRLFRWKTRQAIVTVLAGIGVLALATDADAFVIQNMSTFSVEFDSGGFEGYAVGGDPAPAVAGTWLINKRSGMINTKAEIAGPGSSGPGANEGSNYLKFEIDTPGANVPPPGFPARNGAIAVMAEPAATFDHVTAEFALYMDSSGCTWGGWGNYPLMAFLTTTSGGYGNRHTWATITDGGENWTTLNNDGRQEGQLILAYHDGAEWHNLTSIFGTTNMFIDVDAWHDVKFDLTVGSYYTITVDGVESDRIYIETALAETPVAAFQLFTNDSTVESLYYIDNIGAGEAAASVPEPGTLVLVAGGLLALVVWRRRR